MRFPGRSIWEQWCTNDDLYFLHVSGPGGDALPAHAGLEVKARIYGKTVEIPDERMRGGVSRHTGTMTTSRAVKEGVNSIVAHTSEKSMECIGMPPSPVGANPTPSPLPGWPKPTDKWNYAYAQFLELEKQAGRIKWWWYEPLPWGITLGGSEDKKKYKPDFLVWYPDGLDRRLEFVEVKGFSKNVRDSITRYTVAKSLFPCFDWKMVKRERGGWVDY